MAAKLQEAYERHDQRDRIGAIDAFAFVDAHQFRSISSNDCRAAATALVDALWAKDEIEVPYVTDGVVDQPERLADAAWNRVESALERRAQLLHIPLAYARLTTTAWKRHKVGGDYTTPILEATRLEVEAAVGAEGYPEKCRAGRSGFGELPARYLVAVELHDERTPGAPERIIDVMTPYFETLLALGGDK